MSSITAGPIARPVRVRPARVGAAAPRSSSPVRLTRRGRVVVTLVFLALILVAAVAYGSRTAATSQKGVPVQTTTVVVAPGDTLWGIASKFAAPGKTQDMIYRIEDLNGLDSAAISAGDRLVVPVG